MKIEVDGKIVHITSDDKNLVQVADRAGIPIPAPCYRSGNNRGCCQVCVVEVNGSQKYTCCTPPEDGMEVTVKRPDLTELRKRRVTEYIRRGREGQSCDCGCSADTSCCG
ncbi:MAG: (2Fe-2S)-binding protein [Candidatus Aegiribacteria sp.]|nr:(2Fe-2S)-binding protein [Candidatus Aegiribacteria sp.]MBD3295323.1 (2Fe-2S)-binding protein [Candidatus Fermentibacteria bacterium]